MSPSSPTAPGARPTSRSRPVSTVTTLATVTGVPPRRACETSTVTLRIAAQRSTRSSASGSTRTPHGTIAIDMPRAGCSVIRKVAAIAPAAIAAPVTSAPVEMDWPAQISTPAPAASAVAAVIATVAGAGAGISQT